MTSCGVFRSQVRSVMDLLAKAAVSEICKLVDDGYAVLRLEISRSKEENQTLKRKLKIMELMIAQGCLVPEAEDRMSDRLMCNDDLTSVSGDNQLTTPSSSSYDHLGVSLWRDGDSAVVDETVTDEEQFELHLIKQETVEEDTGQGGIQDTPNMCGDLSEFTAEVGEESPVVEAKMGPTGGLEKLPGRQRGGIWEDSGVDDALKAELNKEVANPAIQCRGPEKRAGKPSGQCYGYAAFDRPALLDAFPVQKQTEEEEAACFYGAKTTSIGVSSDVQSAPAAWTGTESRMSSSASLGSAASMVMDPDYFKVEMDMSSSWDTETAAAVARVQQERHKEQVESEELMCSSLCSTQSQVMGGENLAATPPSSAPGANGWAAYDGRLTAGTHCHGGAAKADRLICVCCGKSFSSPRTLEMHERTHTGEKPFSCTQCEKRFSQLSNLVIHKRVHTGEKPYRCSHCGKQFAQSRYLVTHQRVHTGEKPFKCAQCGKRFAQSNNLIRHQSVHTGKKPFRCSQCGKSFTTSSHRKRHESVHSGRRFPPM